jgi:glycosyltransferase involved in cell wall biosynthesis
MMNEHEKNTIEISVVIPVFNSSNCLPELFTRLTDVLGELNKSYEIILVNDCSLDNSWEQISNLCKDSDKLIGINFRKNFGQDNALMAGLEYSSGETIIIMDDDLQHDPADIPALLLGLKADYDVCYGDYRIKKQTWFKNFGSSFNDRVANVILKKPKKLYLSPYKAIKREIVNEIVKYDGPYPYVDGLLLRVTKNINQVTVEHHFRYAGKSNYNLLRSVWVWSKLATNFSVLPLRIATVLGFISSATGFILAIIFISMYFLGTISPTGWYSTIVSVMFLGGIQLLTIGIIGEYVGRLFLYHSKEPQFVVKEVIGA